VGGQAWFIRLRVQPPNGLAFWGEWWPNRPKTRCCAFGRVCRGPTAWGVWRARCASAARFQQLRAVRSTTVAASRAEPLPSQRHAVEPRAAPCHAPPLPLHSATAEPRCVPRAPLLQLCPSQLQGLCKLLLPWIRSRPPQVHGAERSLGLRAAACATCVIAAVIRHVPQPALQLLGTASSSCWAPPSAPLRPPRRAHWSPPCQRCHARPSACPPAAPPRSPELPLPVPPVYHRAAGHRALSAPRTR
jgi:hypothetical protein